MEMSSNVSVISNPVRGQSAKVNFGAITEQIILQLKISYCSRKPERVKQGGMTCGSQRGNKNILGEIEGLDHFNSQFYLKPFKRNITDVFCNSFGLLELL